MRKTIPLAVIFLAVALAFSSYSANAGVFDPPNGVYTWQWQEYGPRINDLYFRILKPARPPDPVQELFVDSFDGTRLGWTRIGQSPYLDSIYYPTSYVESNIYNATVGLFGFQDVAPLGPGEEIKGVTIDGYAFSEDPDIDLDIYISGEGFDLRYVGSIEATDTWSWVFPSYGGDITNYANTPEKIASLRVLLAYWAPEESSGPAVRLDALRLSIYTRALESRYCTALEAGEVDALLVSSTQQITDFNKLNQEGFTLTNAPGFHYCQIGFNMRKWPFMQDETGNAFRHATAHLVPKEDIIQTLFSYAWGNITDRWDTFVARGQKPWIEPDIDEHPYSIDEAVNILSAAGYTFVDNLPLQGTPSSIVSAGSEDYWLAPNGMPLPAIKFYSPLYPEAPTSYIGVNMTVARMTTAGLTSVAQEPRSFLWYIDKLHYDHDFDMYWLCHSFSSYPNQLYSFFHSSQDFPGGSNLDGIHDSALDAQLEVIKSSTDLTEIENAVSNAQIMIAQLLPHVPVYSRNVVNAFNPDLDGIVNMYGYGIENQWTFLNIHYQGIPVGGTVDWPLSTSVGRVLVDLNPATIYTPSESQRVLDRVFDGLIAEHPETGTYMPWMATNWNIQPWTAPGDIPGMNITFWLRNDIMWQDGTQFTADDIRFALQYLQAYQMPRSEEVWHNLVDVVVPTEDPYKVEIYFNTTNYELLNKVAKISTRFPRHIWEGKDPNIFQPWAEPHPTVPGLTKLIGTGPFYYVEQVPADYVLVRANSNYFKKLPASTSQEVEPSGGTISNVAGTASVEIPPGALEQSTTISMQQHPTSEYGGFLINQSDYIVSFGAYKFEPAGTEFAVDVTITLVYDELLVDEAELGQLKVFSSDDGVNWYQVAIESVDTVQNTVTVKTSHFSLFVILRMAISGTVIDEYTGQPIEGVTISLLETGATVTTDSQGHYSFNNIEVGSYTVEMTVPYGYLTHDAVTKFAVLPGQDKANFTLYQASWSGATVPRTIGYWKNWENHYSRSLMESFVANVKYASGLFDDLTVDSLQYYLTLTRFSTMQQRGEAQLLASWFNVVSAQLGVDVQIDVTSITGWQTVISDADGILNVNELLQQIDTYYITNASLTKEQWEVIKNILDVLNNGRLFLR